MVQTPLKLLFLMMVDFMQGAGGEAIFELDNGCFYVVISLSPLPSVVVGAHKHHPNGGKAQEFASEAPTGHPSTLLCTEESSLDAYLLLSQAGMRFIQSNFCTVDYTFCYTDRL